MNSKVIFLPCVLFSLDVIALIYLGFEGNDAKLQSLEIFQENYCQAAMDRRQQILLFLHFSLSDHQCQAQ